MKDRYLYKAKGQCSKLWHYGMLTFCGDCTCHIKDNLYNEKICDTSTLCQCTGLKDKNGKLIWENDIIKKDFYTDYDNYINSEAYTGRIQYEDGGWSVERTMSNGRICTSAIIDMIAYSKDIEQFEVIGNIFDNPDLLNKREETYCKEESKSDLER